MKVLLVGEFAWPWYEEACAQALEKLGCQVIRFGWLEHFKKWKDGYTEPVYRSLYHRLQYRFIRGPVLNAINEELLDCARVSKPDVAFFYNVQFITRKTVGAMKNVSPATTFCQYANDNPFSPAARVSMWRNFMDSIPLFDLHYAYRSSNVPAYIAHGAKRVEILKPYFITGTDFPLQAAEIPEKYRCDVVFAGHYEDDGRVAALEAVCRAGYKLNLFGGGWDAAVKKLAPDSPLRGFFPVQPVTGLDYNRAICGAKVALCFLSSLNRDTYTRRSFQLPAMRAAVLSQRTEDLAAMFKEGSEISFFSDTGELLEKLKSMVNSPEAREKQAASCYARVYRDGHDVVSRMKQWLDSVDAAAFDSNRI